ncbi:hypothetical protein EDD18DRAFT_1056869, partial [Armillaria luteobubalina]
ETSSKYILNHLSSFLKRMEDAGYVGVPNKDILKVMVTSLQSQKQVTTLKLVKGQNKHQQLCNTDR